MTKQELDIGIYKITNMINSKVYIGQSKEIRRRWKRHKSDIRKEVHRNKHLERAFQSYGEENFTFEVIENCSADKLDTKEQYWIAQYNSNDYSIGYNQDSGGTQGKYINKDVVARARKSRDYKTGIDNPRSLLKNVDDIINIRKMLSEKVDIEAISNMYDVPRDLIRNIKNFKSYTEISSVYDDEIRVINDMDYKLYSNGLSEADISDIKKLISTGELYAVDIAKKYNVNESFIKNIRHLIYFPEISPEYNEKMNIYKPMQPPHSMPDDVVKQIKENLITGEFSNKELAEKYNTDASTISNIKLLRAYENVESVYNDELMEMYGDCKRGDKLTDDEIVLIKKYLVEENKNNNCLAKLFNVDQSIISNIKLLKSYKEIGVEYNQLLEELYVNNVKDKFSVDQIVKIRKLITEGISIKNICDIFDTENHVIGNIKNFKTYANIISEYDDTVRIINSTDGKLIYNNLNESDISDIKIKLSSGEFYNKEIANDYSVNESFIANIRNLKYFPEISPECNSKMNVYKPITTSRYLEVSILKKIKENLITDEFSNKELAEKYNTDASTISRIKTLKAYKEVNPEYNDKLNELYGNIKRKEAISKDKIRVIKETLTLEDNTNAYWGKHFSIDKSTISRIKNLKVYKDIATEYNDILVRKYINT